MQFLTRTIIFVAILLIASTQSFADKENEVAAERWIEVMRSLVPNKFCNKDSTFRKCFDVSDKECESEAIRDVRICLETHKDEAKAAIVAAPKNELRQVVNTWGGKVGGCAGAAWAINQLAKLRNDAKCIKQFTHGESLTAK